MRKIVKSCLILFALCVCSVQTFAQKVVEVDTEGENTVLFVSIDKAHPELVIVLNNSVSPKFNEAGMPQFLLTNKKGTFGLGIGGFVRGIPSVDFGGISDNDNFLPMFITSPNVLGDRSQFRMDITNSQLFLKMVGRTKAVGDIVVYVAGNFTGNDYTFRLHNGYVQFLGILMGYNFTNFMNLHAFQPTICNSGASGAVNYRVTQLSYTYDKLKHWSFVAAAELPTIYDTFGAYNNKYIKSGRQHMPDFVAGITYKWGEKSQVRLAGVARDLSYNTKSGDRWKSKSKFGGGVQLSTIFDLSYNLSMFGEANYGNGISKYVNDTQKLDIDLVPNPDDNYAMQTLPILSFTGGLRYDFNPKLFTTASYSQTRLYSENNWPAANSDFFRYGQEIIVNLFWDPIKNMRTGAEYIRGWKKDFSDAGKLHANRINLLLQYTF